MNILLRSCRDVKLLGMHGSKCLRRILITNHWEHIKLVVFCLPSRVVHVLLLFAVRELIEVAGDANAIDWSSQLLRLNQFVKHMRMLVIYRGRPKRRTKHLMQNPSCTWLDNICMCTYTCCGTTRNVKTTTKSQTCFYVVEMANQEDILLDEHTYIY